ncbi:hypothetical protein HID58_043188 [Brassica napus]|uniref:F-box protein n=1 Tax=Brassica napus TaxID=3708 RepID=A0ABQ8BHE9_BRANA|nr:hypothetical protein HID58_043188 [Brassica napus]
MALGKKRIVTQKSNLKQRRGVEEGGLGIELELVQYKRGFGRKRVLISETRDSVFTSPVGTISSKKLCDKTLGTGGQSRELEDLPLDILFVEISCYFTSFNLIELKIKLLFVDEVFNFINNWLLSLYDMWVKIICGVEHEDLKQLFHVSKTIREATLIAKQSHFAYSTPRKTLVFQLGRYGLDKPFDFGEDKIEAPAAPLQKRYRRINRNEDNSGVSVALFN